MAIGPSMIEQLEDLRSLSTGQLKGMLGTPSPHASPVFIAMVLKEREDAEKRHAGQKAAGEKAAAEKQAPTVMHRLQQPMPMSQAGAVAAAPQQPPMPREAQLAMALSGATGQPPPQLPTVNAARGYRGSAPRQSASSSDAALKAIMDELEKAGVGTYSQMPNQRPFSSKDSRPAGILSLAGIEALLRKAGQERKTSSARGGFVRRPVTAANGTQGRTVYAQDGLRFSPEQVLGAHLTNVNPQVEAINLKALEEAARVRAIREDLLDRVGGYFRGGGETGTTQDVLHPVSRNNVPAGAEVLDGQPQTNVNGSGILTPNALNQQLPKTSSPPVPRSRQTLIKPAGEVSSDSIVGHFQENARWREEIAKQEQAEVNSLSPVEVDAEINLIESAPISDPRGGSRRATRLALLRNRQNALTDMANTGGVDLPIPMVDEVSEQVKITSTETDGITPSPVAEYPPEFTGDQTSPTGGAGRDQFGQIAAALRGRLAALEDQKADDITGQATQFFNTLNEANKKIYSDLETGLKKFEQADAKDFEKFESRFKALDDFYETGKLPERMRKDRITNLMLEMSKGLLGSQDLYSGFKAGLEGFQAVDKASRDEYAKGLAARLTASKGIMDSKMAMRNSRRQEAIAMTRFAAEQNRGNATLAMEQLKIAQQAKQNERTHQINLIRGEATILSADASMAAAMKGTKEERLLKSLPKDMYAAALAKANDGDRTELDTYYRRDSQGNVHANMPAFIALINKMRSSAGGAFTAATFGMRVGAAQQAIISDARKDAKALIKGGFSDPGWAEVAAWGKKMGVHNGDLPSMQNWKPGAKEKNKAWWRKLAENYYRSVDQRAGTVPGGSQGQRNGAAQGGKRDPAVVRSGITGN